jgi:hypothetical protein
MKRTIFTIILILNSMNTFAAKGDVIPGPNQCAAVMDSKVYITSEFHAYPRTVIFECTYKCNANGKIDTLKGTSKVLISNMSDDALLPVCQGLQMKTVPWGYDFDKIVPFYAPDTEIVNLKNWSFENIDFNPQTNLLERARLEKLKKDLYQISSSFIISGNSGGEALRYFKEAGIKISEIADGLPMNTKLLDEVIQQIIVNKGAVMPAQTPESIIYPMVKNAAAWRIPDLRK